MQEINEILSIIDSYIGGSQWFIFLLLGTGLFFTIYLRFPQIRYFRHALRVVWGKYDRREDVGDASHFQALSTALSGTVGTGNIAGVALAIHLGGPSALFWMMVTAFLGMTTKFVEVTLSHKYREKAEDGTIAGGPMYYMKNALNMRWMAAIFAVATVISSFGTGNLPQINSIASSIFNTFGVEPMLTGGILAIILGAVIIGGVKRIVKVTEALVPAMALIYFLGAIAVILYNVQHLPRAFASIFTDIFTGTAATGGFLGASVAFAINRGVNRGLFSNEAGQGSAPIAHAMAKAHEPVSEGVVAILEPFIDTIIICMLTGLAVLSSGVWYEKVPNQFQQADLVFLAQPYSDQIPEEREKLRLHVSGQQPLPKYDGKLSVVDGKIQENITILHARSVAENVKVLVGEQPFDGELLIKDGKLIAQDDALRLTGYSLVHSAPLTIEAFKRGLFGEYGQYIISIGLLLFAFSTVISWSYYGGRAITYLFGTKADKYYRIVYVIGFFLASFTDTTIIWTLSGIAIALMTIPNLVGILLLHKDMKQTVKDYWEMFAKEYPNEPRSS
ncbi:MAG: sodium:alanine symporter family protein [Flammeovirgaceae bacterium]|nr:sodium:alanine symporter family protein [Flammeovirgaceae bacterium]